MASSNFSRWRLGVSRWCRAWRRFVETGAVHIAAGDSRGQGAWCHGEAQDDQPARAERILARVAVQLLERHLFSGRSNSIVEEVHVRGVGFQLPKNPCRGGWKPTPPEYHFQLFPRRFLLPTLELRIARHWLRQST